MRSNSAVVAVAAGLLPSAVRAVALKGGPGEFLDVCSVEAVLEYFTCRRTIPAGCVDNLAEQATAWCSSYLSVQPVTVYLSTQTPVVTATVTETATTSATSVELEVTTVESTATAISTDVVQQTVTATVTVSDAPAAVSPLKRQMTPSGSPSSSVSAAPSCIDLKTKNLLHHPASKLSKACSCLNPQPTTVTIGVTTAAASTLTATQTDVVTAVVSQTSVSTEVDVTVVTEGVTVTSTTTETATVSLPAPSPTLGRCQVSYDPAGNGVGNTILTPSTANALECCELCGTTLNCVASAFPGSCQLLVKVSPSSVDENPQCPLGKDAYFANAQPDPNGIVFKGPCAL